MGTTSIEWCDRVWNPVTGCTKVSAGCARCYAEKVADRFWKDRQFTEVRCHEDRLDQPLRWRKPSRVFVNSMSDLFHEDVPAEFVLKVYEKMGAAFHHTFQILTKRPERARQLYPWLSAELQKQGRVGLLPYTWKHVWLGVSVEDQKTADERIPLLLQTPAAVRFVSYEPALGPVDFYRGGFSFLERLKSPQGKQYEKLDWVIVGGESGPGARPFNIQWARNVIKQCRAWGVACFVKQMGSVPQTRNDQVADVWYYADGSDMDTVEGPRHPEYQYQGGTVTLKLNDRKGGDMSEWPEDLRVRQFPR